MYDVLLADDEQSIVDSMVHHFPWTQYGMRVAYTASTGNDAYNILVNTPPDVAVLDIRMPGYNGLELCRLIAQKRLKTQVIIVSGYAEFSYAQKAIQYGVLGYCLKPVEYDELPALLLKAAHNLEQTPASVTADTFLDAIEDNNIDKIRLYLEANNLFEESYYLASSVSDTALLLPGALAFRSGPSQFAYLSCCPYDESLFQNALLDAGVLGIGIYPLPVGLSDFRSAFYKCTAMSYHFFLDPKNRICDSYPDFASLPLMSQIQNAISFAEKERLCELLTLLKTDDSYKQFSIHSARQLFNMIVSNPNLAADAQDYFIHSHRQLIHDYASFQDMMDSLIQIIRVCPREQEAADSLSNTYFLKIMKYINTYYNENITLRHVAKIVNMNPNYISQIFKKSTGTTFSHYLTDLRISNAKKMLLSTDISITDISMQTGFNDYFYFLKTFKKYTGCTPSDYREAYYRQG